MTEHNRQFDDPEARVSDRLRRDLHGLFEPPGAVPARVEKAILDQAHGRLAKPRRLILRLRWAAGVAVAAAIVVGVVLYDTSLRQNPRSEISDLKSTGPALAEGRAGEDSERAAAPLGNPVAGGRVDILDAFRLARQIEAGGPVDPRWDLNGDGKIDRADVDLLARAAVRLTSGAQARCGTGILPVRGEAILASLLPLRNALTAPQMQEQDARATNPSANPLGKGV